MAGVLAPVGHRLGDRSADRHPGRRGRRGRRLALLAADRGGEEDGRTEGGSRAERGGHGTASADKTAIGLTLAVVPIELMTDASVNINRGPGWGMRCGEGGGDATRSWPRVAGRRYWPRRPNSSP